MERPSGETSPYVAWGEELDMLLLKGEQSYTLELPLADQLTGGAAAEALRLELSAYEDSTLIDSTSTDVQILDDPFEHRNPLPDVALLAVLVPELLKGFVGGDDHQQPPQAVAVVELGESALSHRVEKAVEGVLDHILLVGGRAVAELEFLPGQGDQPAVVAFPELLRGGRVAVLERRNPVGDRAGR